MYSFASYFQEIPPFNKYSDYLAVAVGVIIHKDKVLIAKRKKTATHGDLWEFPGGKIEQGETVISALNRELEEEIGINIIKASPLILIPYTYTYTNNNKVLLYINVVTEFKDERQLTLASTGKEGQKIKWVEISRLKSFHFPAANKGVIKALLLPNSYGITADFSSFKQQEISNLCLSIKNTRVSLLQLRSLKTTLENIRLFIEFAQKKQICIQLNSRLYRQLLKQEKKKLTQLLQETQTDSFAIGLHLSSSDLMTDLIDKNLCQGFHSASCHHENDIKRANELSLDFIVLSPVKHTSSHPQEQPLGWNRFSQLAITAQMPVYALGGLNHSDIKDAIYYGGQGIAGISFCSLKEPYKKES